MHRRYELMDGSSNYASLTFKSAFGTLAEARTVAASWTFKRRGFLHPNVGARVAGNDEDIAVYTPHWTHHKGAIRLSSGESLHFHSEGFWGTRWILATEDGKPLAEFSRHGALKHGCEVTLRPDARAREDLGLLLCFCWYLLLLHMEEAVVVTG